jgi:hypothetical protein
MSKEAIQNISQDIFHNESLLQKNNKDVNSLIINDANSWINNAKSRPIPKMLFSELWYENELCILFSDTNLGKSILAVQIADSLSYGVSINGFKLECAPQKVLFLDFELSDKQFENRYAENFTNHYQFHHNFLRAELNTEETLPSNFKNYEEYLCATLPVYIEETQATILIVDNLTFLSAENEKAKDALVLMKILKQLSKTKGISILVLAHTPKRDDSKPITKNDLAGSKMLMNFCDSCFAIGKSSQDPSFRYIKQLKQRNTEHIYHAENIILCSIDKATNFLEFCFEEFDLENNHLNTNNTINSNEINEQIKLLISEGLSNVKIGDRLSLSEGAIRKRRKKLGI